jgi:hypothetical protein
MVPDLPSQTPQEHRPIDKLSIGIALIAVGLAVWAILRTF